MRFPLGSEESQPLWGGGNRTVSRQRSLGTGHTDPGLACFSIPPWPGSWGPLGLAPTLPPPLSSADGSGCGHRQL